MEQLLQRVLVELRADDADAARDLCAAAAHIALAGDIVKVDPAAVDCGHDALGAQHNAVFLLVKQRLEDSRDLVVGVLARGLGAPACEHLVGVVMVVVVVMVVAAAADLTVLMMVMMVLMLLIVVMVVMMLVLLIVVVMVAALVLLAVLMMVVVMLMLLILILVMMMAAAAFLVLIMMMVVMLMRLSLEVRQLRLERGLALHRLEDLRAGDLVPRRGDDGRDRVLLTQQGDAGIELLLAQALGAGEDDGAGMLDLVVEKLAKVLHIDLALRGVDDGGKAVEDHFVALHALHGADDVRELADAGGLDEDAVGVELLHHLTERGGKVAHERAADAAGVHFIDRDAGVLQEPAVNGDLTEFVFDEDDLLTLIRLGDQLLDERRFSRAEKAGKDVDFSHVSIHFLSEMRWYPSLFYKYSISQLSSAEFLVTGLAVCGKTRYNVRMEQNNHEQGRIARVLLAAVAVAILILLICNIAQQTGSSDPSAAAQASASPEESATPEPTGEPQTDAVAEAQRLLDGMSTREKICQLLIVFPEQYLGASDGITTVTPELVQMLEEYPVSGMLLSLQNMTDADQLLALTSGLQAASRFPLILCVDEEGGDVARLMEKVGTTKLHSMYSYRDQGPDVARANGRTLGQDLARFGFNTDLAPVADVWSNPENKVIGTRAYSDDFGEAAALVAAAVQGFHDSGCICCLKHFPGHGSTRTDTHKEAAFVDATLDELRENEFLPFQSGIDAGADMVME